MIARIAIIGMMIVQMLSLSLAAQTEQSAPVQTQDAANAFSDAIASRLLSTVREGLEAHMSRKMLGAFDLAKMSGGSAFRDQITVFFNQYESIRVHFKLQEVTGNVAVVDAEMEMNPGSDIGAAQHKHLQLRFTVAGTAGGWKFVDVNPRSFFS